MTFTDKEQSVDDGQPFELYDFVRGTWHAYLTTRPTEFFVNTSRVYKPSAINRDRVRHGEDSLKDSITITLPRGHEIVEHFIHSPSERRTSITIRQLHYGLDFNEAIVIWKGRVVSGAPTGQKVELTCESIFTAMRKQGLRFRCELLCQHVLYSSMCRASQPSMRVDDTISSMPSATVLEMTTNTSGYEDGWFSGGIIQGPDGADRYITKHVGSTIYIDRGLDSLAPDVDVALYPGCDRTRNTCRDKFNNLNNFLGFPWIPTANPFQVDLRT